jgi:hypothetical protein
MLGGDIEMPKAPTHVQSRNTSKRYPHTTLLRSISEKAERPQRRAEIVNFESFCMRGMWRAWRRKETAKFESF